ncbi:hypothetical protein Taro_052863 [Colocasia esculenta]|uniref:Uncharacterized protein n=1 Tax=Colocasia esculenta TaxID=4460 RepID=A0A843XJR5_COLES|nr:hypothetical protein [Colocasia esculenta]
MENMKAHTAHIDQEIVDLRIEFGNIWQTGTAPSSSSGPPPMTQGFNQFQAHCCPVDEPRGGGTVPLWTLQHPAQLVFLHTKGTTTPWIPTRSSFTTEGNTTPWIPPDLPSHQKGTHPEFHQVFLHTRREQAQDKNKQENKPLDQDLARQDLKLLALRK